MKNDKIDPESIQSYQSQGQKLNHGQNNIYPALLQQPLNPPALKLMSQQVYEHPPLLIQVQTPAKICYKIGFFIFYMLFTLTYIFIIQINIYVEYDYSNHYYYGGLFRLLITFVYILNWLAIISSIHYRIAIRIKSIKLEVDKRTNLIVCTVELESGKTY